MTASLLFHKTPTNIAQAILKEGFRLLKPRGQILIIEEPYIEEYAAGSIDAWLGQADFSQLPDSRFLVDKSAKYGGKID